MPNITSYLPTLALPYAATFHTIDRQRYAHINSVQSHQQLSAYVIIHACLDHVQPWHDHIAHHHHYPNPNPLDPPPIQIILLPFSLVHHTTRLPPIPPSSNPPVFQSHEPPNTTNMCIMKTYETRGPGVMDPPPRRGNYTSHSPAGVMRLPREWQRSPSPRRRSEREVRYIESGHRYGFLISF
jgi:hypothetical protein